MSAPNYDGEYLNTSLPETTPEILDSPETKCLSCPLQMFVAEEARINNTENDHSSAKAWETFGSNILHACRIGEPEVAYRKRYLLFGEEQVVIRCSSSSSKSHRSKLRTIVLPANPSE